MLVTALAPGRTNYAPNQNRKNTNDPVFVVYERKSVLEHINFAPAAELITFTARSALGSGVDPFLEGCSTPGRRDRSNPDQSEDRSDSPPRQFRRGSDPFEPSADAGTDQKDDRRRNQYEHAGGWPAG